MWDNRSRLGAVKQLQEGMFRFVKKKVGIQNFINLPLGGSKVQRLRWFPMDFSSAIAVPVMCALVYSVK